jgi:hypothetical protein
MQIKAEIYDSDEDEENYLGDISDCALLGIFLG